MKENYRVKDIYHSLTRLLIGTIKQFVDFLWKGVKHLWDAQFDVNIMIWQGRVASSVKILAVKGSDGWWIMDVSQLLLDPHTQPSQTFSQHKWTWKYYFRNIRFPLPHKHLKLFPSQVDLKTGGKWWGQKSRFCIFPNKLNWLIKQEKWFNCSFFSVK